LASRTSGDRGWLQGTAKEELGQWDYWYSRIAEFRLPDSDSRLHSAFRRLEFSIFNLESAI
jgi:hypothetical protein